MAYIDTNPRNNRVVIIGTIAAIHGLAGYALVSGLAANYYTEVTTILEARNIPLEKPEPLPPPPEPKRAVKPPETTITRVDPKIVLGPPMHLPPVDFGPQDRVVVDPPISQPVPAPQPAPPRVAKPIGRVGEWVTTNDYPARDLREGNQGATGFTLTVGEDGKVRSCAVTRSSGFAGLDAATCRHLQSRARFKPAADGDGRPVAGEYSNTIRWVIPE